MTYKRSDMLFTYSWTAGPGDNPKLRGEPDRSLFNRSEGYEVLYMINKFLEKKGLVSVASGNKAERLIQNDLPSKIFSQVELLAWLDQKW